jgi:hypothetical protein
MNVCLIRRLTIVEASCYSDLMAAWKSHGKSMLVGQFVCKARLTDAQYARLPKSLKRCLRTPPPMPRRESGI